MLRYFMFGMVLFSVFGFSRAQDISFHAEAAKTEVSINERFSVRFILSYGQANLSIDKPMSMPDFGGLIPIGESNVSSFQFNNGEVQNQTGKEVILVAEKEGEYQVGSASITLNGKEYQTEPIRISVKKGLKPKVEGGKKLQGAFLSAEISNDSPYVNQEAVLVVRVFARDYSLLRKLQDYREPDFHNLTVKHVSERLEDDEKQVLINGTTFISKVIARYIVFPRQPGELTIDPFSLSVMLADYFGVQTVELTTPELLVHVRELPSGEPKNFSGAVGDFKINASLSKKEVKTDEAVNLEVEIIGSGNLGTFSTPEVKLPEDIESFSPKKRNAFEARPTGMKGKVVENFVLVPHYGGDYKIDPLVFNFFNPEEEKYMTLQSEAFELKVKGPKAPVKKDTTAGTQAITDHVRSDSTAKNYSLSPPSLDEVKNKMSEAVTHSPVWYWFAGIALLLAVILFGVFRNKKRRSKGNPALAAKQMNARFKTEINTRFEDLKKAVSGGDNAHFLSIQEDILTQIGMHYSGLSLSDFTENEAAEKMKAQYDGLAERWKELLLECKQEKYAFGGSRNSLSEKYQATQTLWKSFN